MKIIDVWAEWCGPCKLMAPVLDTLERDYGISVEKVDADTNPDFMHKYNIQSVPTLLVYKDDQIVNRIVGYKPLNRLVAELGIDS